MMTDNQITIYEVGPRDGLQYESLTLAPEVITKFIAQLVESGLKWIEAGSFVSQKAVPQMQNSAEVLQNIQQYQNIHFPVLVPNQKGLDAALAAGAKELAVFTAASEAFLKANIRCGIEESFERFQPIFEVAAQQPLFVRGYISCTMGCPYQGEVSLTEVARVAKTLHKAGCSQICLADTIGVGVPEAVPELIDAVLDEGIPVESIALHFHDTEKRLAIPKIIKGIEKGVRVIDSAVGNLGGCPYAPGASGNVATESVIEALHAEGLETGIDLEALLVARDYIFNQLGRKPGT